jgi:hypothetical protein
LADVVGMLDRYAAADQDLTLEVERLAAHRPSRISQSTVTRLTRLIENSLVPGVNAKAELAELPAGVRRAGIVQWARSLVDPARRAARTTGRS